MPKTLRLLFGTSACFMGLDVLLMTRIMPIENPNHWGVWAAYVVATVFILLGVFCLLPRRQSVKIQTDPEFDPARGREASMYWFWNGAILLIGAFCGLRKIQGAPVDGVILATLAVVFILVGLIALWASTNERVYRRSYSIASLAAHVVLVLLLLVPVAIFFVLLSL